MAKCHLECKISVAWWFTYLYLPSIKLFCLTFGTEPDMDKVSIVAMKAVSVSAPKVVHNV